MHVIGHGALPQSMYLMEVGILRPYVSDISAARGIAQACIGYLHDLVIHENAIVVFSSVQGSKIAVMIDAGCRQPASVVYNRRCTT